jgi:hypothetical protein
VIVNEKHVVEIVSKYISVVFMWSLLLMKLYILESYMTRFVVVMEPIFSICD